MRALVALCTGIVLSACQAEPPDPRGIKGAETFLTISATGRADSRPDEAWLQLVVQSVAASASEASRANRVKMDRVTAALRDLGVKADDLQTQNLILQRIDYGREGGSFRADNVVEVKLRDMTKVGQAVTVVTEAGANLLSGPELRVSDHEASNRSAYAAAYRAARARADAYAGAAGLEVKRIIAIYDGGESYAPPPYTRTMSVEQAAPAAPPPPPSAPFNPGVSSVEVRVRVDFALAK